MAIRRALTAPAIVVVCLLGVVAAGEELQDAFLLHGDDSTSGSRVVDRVSRHERRLAGLRPLLPDSGMVGYASAGLRGRSFASLEAMQDFFLTQYVLAPVIVVRSADLPLVVGDYGSAAGAPFTGRAPPGYRVLVDLGNGVVLLGEAP